jgi:NAD(P)-dependent dehydrogenase (short-subunit alcohol dehydrogenase family)
MNNDMAVQKALPFFQDGGSIFLTASIGGSKGFEGASVYSATKAAIRSFARSWSVDLKDRKIRVNAVSPGSIATPMATSAGRGLTEEKAVAGLGSRSRRVIMSWLRKQFKKSALNSVPLGRVGNPDEIAKPSPSLHPMTAVISQVLNCS